MPGDARGIHTGNEIPLGEAFQRRKRKAWILREEPIGRDAKVGEVAPPSARDADFLARGPGVINHHHTPPTPRSLDPGHKPGRARPQNCNIHPIHMARIAVATRPVHRPIFSLNASCTAQSPSLNTAARLGRSQVVRQRFLVPPFLGSIPSAPAKLPLQHENCATPKAWLFFRHGLTLQPFAGHHWAMTLRQILAALFRPFRATPQVEARVALREDIAGGAAVEKRRATACLARWTFRTALWTRSCAIAATS